ADHSCWIDGTKVLKAYIVHIQNHLSRPDAVQSLKHLLFSEEVGFHVTVKIEMVAAEVRKNGNIDIQPGSPLHLHCMRRNLHNALLAWRVNDLAEQFFNVRSLRRRSLSREIKSRPPVLDGAKNGRRLAGGL